MAALRSVAVVTLTAALSATLMVPGWAAPPSSATRAVTADPNAYVPLQTTVGGRPTGIAVSGITAVVADSAAGAAVTFSTCLPKSCTPEQTASGPTAVGTDPSAAAVAGDAVYVANSGSGTVTVLSVASGAIGGVRATVPVGGTPAGIAADASGSRVYVADNAGNRVVVIDTASNAVVGSIAVGAGPWGVAVADGRAYVANQRDSTVSVVDLAAGAVVQTVAVGTAPGGVAVAGDRLVVSNNGAGSVSIVDLTSGAVDATVPVGSQPWGVAVSGTSAFVANYGSGTVSVVDVASARVIATVTTGGNPFAVAVNQQAAFVTNSGSGTVSSIALAATVPAPTWQVRTRVRTVIGQVSWSPAVEYRMVARKGKATRAGTCTRSGASVACRIRLPRGEWRVSVLRTLPWQSAPAVQQGKRVRF